MGQQVADARQPHALRRRQRHDARAEARFGRPARQHVHDSAGGECFGETYIGRYGAGQRWHYFSAQRRDEVIAFKHFDSAEPIPGLGAAAAVAAVAPHTAFEHPDTPADAPLRASLELRVLAHF
jgi:hypothetical protein